MSVLLWAHLYLFRFKVSKASDVLYMLEVIMQKQVLLIQITNNVKAWLKITLAGNYQTAHANQPKHLPILELLPDTFNPSMGYPTPCYKNVIAIHKSLNNTKLPLDLRTFCDKLRKKPLPGKVMNTSRGEK